MIKVIIFISCIIAGISGQGKNTTGDDKPRGIVGGVAVPINEYPYQVAMLVRQSQTCGASIINNDWVITAAHCCIGTRPSAVTIRVGSDRYDEGGAEYQIHRIIYNKNYNSTTDDYDICVMKTKLPIIYNENVTAIEMVSEGTTYEIGVNAKISGWGNTEASYHDTGSEVLQAVNIPLISNNDCNEMYKTKLKSVTDRQICANHPDGGKDSCQGDSGGPMVINRKLAGIVSWGIGCGTLPGVYTNVAVFRPWIRKITNV